MSGSQPTRSLHGEAAPMSLIFIGVRFLQNGAYKL